jgi:lipoate-protein ligase B
MSYWEGIIGCGLADYHETSLAELNPPVPNMERVMDALVRSFGKVFDFQMHEELLKQRYQS